MTLLSVIIALGSALADELPASEEGPEMWAGRMAVFGERKLPFLGTIEFRNDNYVIAEVVPTEDGGFQLSQRVCKVAFEKVAGAQASMDETGPRSMPVARPMFVPMGDAFHAEPWPSGWNAEDHDDDGFPGIAVKVAAPLCGGTMHFASDATTIARAVDYHGGLKGLATVRVAQEVHKVQGACLSLVTKDVTQDLTARFAYLPVPKGTTCDTVPEEAWVDPATLEFDGMETPTLPPVEEEEE